VIISIDECPEAECAGLICPRLRAQSARWRRTFGMSSRLESWYPVVGGHDQTMRVLRQELELNVTSGYATDLEGVKKHTPPGLRFEVHETADDGTGQPALVAMYAGDDDPVELLARMPVWEEDE